MGLKNIIPNFVPPKKVIKMRQIPRIYRRFIPQLLHMIVLPVFFFTFMLIYEPFDSVDFLGREWFGVHLTIISCITLLSVILMRLLYYFLPLSLTYALYTSWCITEIVFTSFFAALYLWLVLDQPMQYFEVLAVSFQYISFALVIPYIILALSLRIYEYNEKSTGQADSASQRMRFYDEKHNLKIVLDSVFKEAVTSRYSRAEFVVTVVHGFDLDGDIHSVQCFLSSAEARHTFNHILNPFI